MEYVDESVDKIYIDLTRNLMYGAPTVGNTRELNNMKITLTDITNNIVSVRGISPSYLFGELLWYFNGDNSLKFISQFSKFWEQISDDGETCNSAYGYLMMKKHGFNQIEKVIEVLSNDPNSRRAKININVPNANVDTTKDEPCTMSLHFMIRNGKLDCTAVMRSNDIWFGFPYDVAFFTELQKYIACKLMVGYGTYTHFAVSLHVYERDYGKLEELRSAGFKRKKIEFNRLRFYENLDLLFDVARDHGKEALMKQLAFWDIYKEV